VKKIYFKTLNIYFFSITIKIKFLYYKVNILKTLPRLLSIFTLFFTLMFSSTSFAEWFAMTRNKNGDTFYVDFDRLRNHDGYIYYWALTDYLKPSEDGYLSVKSYYQTDCKLFRFMLLSIILHKQPMGRGVAETHNLKNPEWSYPSPKSVDEVILEDVCFLQY